MNPFHFCLVVLGKVPFFFSLSDSSQTVSSGCILPFPFPVYVIQLWRLNFPVRVIGPPLARFSPMANLPCFLPIRNGLESYFFVPLMTLVPFFPETFLFFPQVGTARDDLTAIHHFFFFLFCMKEIKKKAFVYEGPPSLCFLGPTIADAGRLHPFFLKRC